MKTHDTAVTGHSVALGLDFWNCNCTCDTHDRNTMVWPKPVSHPTWVNRKCQAHIMMPESLMTDVDQLKFKYIIIFTCKSKLTRGSTISDAVMSLSWRCHGMWCRWIVHEPYLTTQACKGGPGSEFGMYGWIFFFSHCQWTNWLCNQAPFPKMEIWQHCCATFPWEDAQASQTHFLVKF